MSIGETARDAGLDALRWVLRTIEATGGQTLVARSADAGSAASFDVEDSLYAGTAGYLFAGAEAFLGGWAGPGSDVLGLAELARDRLLAVAAERGPAAAATDPGDTDPGDFDRGDFDLGYHTGVAGELSALLCWARVTGDPAAAAGAARVAVQLGERVAAGSLSDVTDVVGGAAGIALALVDEGSPPSLEVAVRLSEGLVASAIPAGAGLEWQMMPSYEWLMPNFSHGGAGVSFALGTVGAAAGRPDLIAAAVAGARRLVELGSHSAGWAVPRYLPPHPLDDGAPSFGWCHGPAGTARLFLLLDRLQPGAGWDVHAAACLAALRASGLPQRLFPGFWDNVGQCCGTAGVGETVLDRYQWTGDASWLEWADVLAADVLSRRITDSDGTRWSNTEHRLDPAELPPTTGHMQGASGIACWLLRLARVHREGPTARMLPWPDRILVTATD